MAVGDIVSNDNLKRSICLMTAQTTNNSPPTDGLGSVQGVPCYANKAELRDAADKGAFFPVEEPELATLNISSSAGSGTMVGTFTLWAYKAATGVWFPIKVNNGAALAETASDKIRYEEKYTNLGHYDRLYLELSAVGGTSTAFEAYLTVARKGGS